MTRLQKTVKNALHLCTGGSHPPRTSPFSEKTALRCMRRGTTLRQERERERRETGKELDCNFETRSAVCGCGRSALHDVDVSCRRSVSAVAERCRGLAAVAVLYGMSSITIQRHTLIPVAYYIDQSLPYSASLASLAFDRRCSRARDTAKQRTRQQRNRPHRYLCLDHPPIDL